MKTFQEFISENGGSPGRPYIPQPGPSKPTQPEGGFDAFRKKYGLPPRPKKEVKEDAASDFRSGQLAYQSSTPVKLAARRAIEKNKLSSAAARFKQKSLERTANIHATNQERRQAYQDRIKGES